MRGRFRWMYTQSEIPIRLTSRPLKCISGGGAMKVPTPIVFRLEPVSW